MQSGCRRKPHELLSVITRSFQESLWISVTLFFNLLLREAGIRYSLIKNKGKKGRRGQVEENFILYILHLVQGCVQFVELNFQVFCLPVQAITHAVKYV